MKAILEIFLLILLLPSIPGTCATLIVDSFTEDDFFLSTEGFGSQNSMVSSPFGSRRFSSISSRIAAPGTVITTTLDSNAGTLTSLFDGQSTSTSRLNFQATYFQGGPFSVLGYDAFEFDFSALAGTGFLIVELGSGSDTYGPATNRIAIDSPGTVSVPFSELNFGTGGAIDSFLAIHFVFEADSEMFSFTLDEIRVVPEPSRALLTLVGLCAVRIPRRRR